MRSVYVALLIFAIPFCSTAQKATTASGGNWVDPLSWTLGVPASGPTDDVTMATGAALTVRNIDNLTSGSIDAGNNNTLTVNGDVSNTGHLDVGDASNTQSITAGTSMAIVANDGIIVIWGDLVVNNSLAITIQGPVGAIIIKGNLIMANNASLIVNGTLTVGGNFTGGTATGVTVGSGGAINVDGTLSVGPGSHVNLNCASYSPDTGCGTFHAHACDPGSPPAFCASLPVELIAFKAQTTLSAIELKWTTASELNFDYFILEKSRDGKSFEEVTSVMGNGTSRIQHEYTFVDQQPTIGVTYYRLTEVDLDRSVHHLKIVRVLFSGEKSISIYPNPVTDGHANFELNFAPENEVLVSIIDLRGAVLSTFVLQQRNISLPLQLNSGVYLVNLQSNGFKTVSRLLVK